MLCSSVGDGCEKSMTLKHFTPQKIPKMEFFHPFFLHACEQGVVICLHTSDQSRNPHAPFLQGGDVRNGSKGMLHL